jgi:uncharacterized protein (TIGR03083 family)
MRPVQIYLSRGLSRLRPVSEPAASFVGMTIDYLAHLRSESARFGVVLTDADPSAKVPTCPDWTAADLLWHLAEVQLFWGAIVRDRLDDPEAADAGKPERPADYAELLTLYRDASAALADTLAATADDVPVWTWLDKDQSAGFVRRRQAHEALIHRIDAELAAGIAVTDLDAALAADGVLEVLDWMFGGVPEWADHEIDGVVGRIAATDAGGQWFVQLGRWSGLSPNTGKTYTDEVSLNLVDGGEPSFEISGTAHDLDAWLWNRPAKGAVAIDGDATAFEAVIRGGVQ